jgi:glycogen debranching enzyme
MADDASIRPNQILAVSLRHSMLPKEKAEMVLQAVERELLTPVGLRTLSPRDPQYKGRYEGGPAERDAAYHQGTVWPWLLGPYVSACLKTRGKADTKYVDTGLNPTGLIPEIFDGDAPHAARGCIAQAWSLGEMLRVDYEYKNRRP